MGQSHMTVKTDIWYSGRGSFRKIQQHLVEATLSNLILYGLFIWELWLSSLGGTLQSMQIISV